MRNPSGIDHHGTRLLRLAVAITLKRRRETWLALEPYPRVLLPNTRVQVRQLVDLTDADSRMRRMLAGCLVTTT
jgi:hypothetical protein